MGRHTDETAGETCLFRTMNRDARRYVPSGGGQNRRNSSSSASNVSLNRGYMSANPPTGSYSQSYGAMGSRGSYRRQDSGYKLLRNIENDNSFFR